MSSSFVKMLLSTWPLVLVLHILSSTFVLSQPGFTNSLSSFLQNATDIEGNNSVYDMVQKYLTSSASGPVKNFLVNLPAMKFNTITPNNGLSPAAGNLVSDKTTSAAPFLDIKNFLGGLQAASMYSGVLDTFQKSVSQMASNSSEATSEIMNAFIPPRQATFETKVLLKDIKSALKEVAHSAADALHDACKTAVAAFHEISQSAAALQNVSEAASFLENALNDMQYGISSVPSNPPLFEGLSNLPQSAISGLLRNATNPKPRSVKALNAQDAMDPFFGELEKRMSSEGGLRNLFGKESITNILRTFRQTPNIHGSEFLGILFNVYGKADCNEACRYAISTLLNEMLSDNATEGHDNPDKNIVSSISTGTLETDASTFLGNRTSLKESLLRMGISTGDEAGDEKALELWASNVITDENGNMGVLTPENNPNVGSAMFNFGNYSAVATTPIQIMKNTLPFHLPGNVGNALKNSNTFNAIGTIAGLANDNSSLVNVAGAINGVVGSVVGNQSAAKTLGDVVGNDSSIQVAARNILKHRMGNIAKAMNDIVTKTTDPNQGVAEQVLGNGMGVKNVAKTVGDVVTNGKDSVGDFIKSRPLIIGDGSASVMGSGAGNLGIDVASEISDLVNILGVNSNSTVEHVINSLVAADGSVVKRVQEVTGWKAGDNLGFVSSGNLGLGDLATAFLSRSKSYLLKS